MARTAIVGLFAVVLAIGVWFLWPQGESASTGATTVLAVQPTTTKASDITTSTILTSTTETASESHVVETVEEAEEILRELWFGWFEGIYNQDEDRIREVVATEEQVAEATDQFGVMVFAATPTADSLNFNDLELLRSDDQCLSVWATVSADFREGSSEGVHIVRRSGESWLFASYWTLKEDLWEADCETQLD
jgi:hypothetical protein